MKKLKTLAYVFKNSLLKPAYYAHVLKAPFSFSLKYFLALFSLLSLITIIVLSTFLVTKAQPYLDQLKTKFPGIYPQELIVTVKNGQLSTNVPEPYFVPLKPEWFPQDLKQALENQPINNILVIDTKVEPSEIRKYQTFVLLTKEAVAFMSGRNEIRIQSLQDVKDFTLNKDVVYQLWQQVTPYFKFIVPILIGLLLVLMPMGIILGEFLPLIFFSLITWLIAKVLKLKAVGYAKALQINLHAITLPTVITAIFQLFGSNPQIPFFQTIILLIFNLVIFSHLKESIKKV